MADGHSGGDGMRVDDNVRRDSFTCEWHVLKSGCSKLATLLVNVSLKFKTLILQTHWYLLLENNSAFDNVAGIYLTR